MPSLAPFPQPTQVDLGRGLEALARTARAEPGQAGWEALHALQVLLGELAPTEENGKVLLRLLDEGAFHELRGDDGTPTRELAVAALLRLGYPWALQIHPDELAWYRALERRKKRDRILILLGIGAAAAVLETFLLGLL